MTPTVYQAKGTAIVSIWCLFSPSFSSWQAWYLAAELLLHGIAMPVGTPTDVNGSLVSQTNRKTLKNAHYDLLWF